MKKISIRLLMLLMLCFTGCGTTEKAGGEGVEVVTPAPTMSISDIFQPEATPVVVDISSSGILTDEREPVVGTDFAAYNAVNRMLKMDAGQSQDSLFCIAEDMGAVYFVNQKQDYYIYRLKDGVAELAVPIPAKELYYLDGILYFMVESYDKYELQGMKDWDIYAYNPVDGTVELVYGLGEAMENVDASIEFMQKMTVDENGIYFLGKIEGKQIEYNGDLCTVIESESCCLPFGATEPVTDDRNMTIAGWGDYYLGNRGNICLIPRATSAVEDIVNVSEIAYNYCLLEDEVYSLLGQRIIKVNLLTWERTEYDCEPILRERVSLYADSEIATPQFIAFTVTEDSIWVFDSANYVVRIARDSGEISCYRLGTKVAEETVYTDGASVYALTSSGVAKIFTEEAAESDESVPVLETELLVK